MSSTQQNFTNLIKIDFDFDQVPDVELLDILCCTREIKQDLQNQDFSNISTVNKKFVSLVKKLLKLKKAYPLSTNDSK